jgi:hypothetical protein
MSKPPAPRHNRGKRSTLVRRCGKQRYRDSDQAKLALRRIQATGGREATPVRWYFCDFCHGYHLTSRP